MPAPEALTEAGRRLDVQVSYEVVASNELLMERMNEGEPFDVVFPSDYAVERLRAAGRLVAIDKDALPLESLAPWAREAPHDPGCGYSVPFAFGTTGFLHDASQRRASSWNTLFEPPRDERVGMLGEVREVIGAALIATGHSPNATDSDALDAAQALLLAQHPHVVSYDSDDFVATMLSRKVCAQHAWSGPAALAMRGRPWLEYVVPAEGALLWITTAAIPADAPDPDASLALVSELMDPQLAATTTRTHGYATPNVLARELLPAPLRDSTVLFPGPAVLARCHQARDLGVEETAMRSVFRALAQPQKVDARVG
jgi:spermidine/putrescine-binding protein